MIELTLEDLGKLKAFEERTRARLLAQYPEPEQRPKVEVEVAMEVTAYRGTLLAERAIETLARAYREELEARAAYKYPDPTDELRRRIDATIESKLQARQEVLSRALMSERRQEHRQERQGPEHGWYPGLEART